VGESKRLTWVVHALPTGTVTLVFTDVEGSTRLLHELGNAYAEALADHRRVLREAFANHGGIEVDTQGDAFFAAFAKASDALAAVSEARDALAGGPIRVRIGLHTGEPLLTKEGYVGVDVHRAARIMSAGHGGQVLLSAQTHALLGDVEVVTDLGLHRLKDMRAPERLFQLGTEEFPPLKTLDATNLPVAASALLGRERELRQLKDLLRRDRLITVTGAGGTGKTRLAVQVAGELVGSIADGVFWVPLAQLSDSDLVLPTIAQTLSTRVDLDEFLHGKELLLLLDNFEHVADAATAVAALLAHSEGLRILVTSRTPLHLSQEHEYPLEPLPPNDAATLFLERAHAAGRTLTHDDTVDDVCRRLDGLPLAIELAAARTRLLRPELLLQRLEHALGLLTGGARDAPARQRTLQATIEWSYELLGEDAKGLFARLACFAGTFSLEAAETVCDADLDVLQELVENNLVKPTSGGRYFMLATIHEYATDRLDERNDAPRVRRRHAEFFAVLAEGSQAALRSQAVRLALAEDEPNLRAALAFCAGARDSELMLRLVSALYFYWFNRDQIAEGKRWLEAAISAAPPSRTYTRARGLKGLASMHGAEGDFAGADPLIRQALSIFQELGDEREVASCLNNLGVNTWRQGDPKAAETLFEQAFTVLQDPVPLENLTHLAFVRGDLAAAAALAKDELKLSLASQNDVNAAVARRHLAVVAALERRYDVASPIIRRLLEGAGDNDLRRHVTECIVLAAFVMWRQGNAATAVALARAAVAERLKLGLTPWELPHYPYADMLIEGLEAGGYDLSRHLTSALPLEDAVELAVGSLTSAA
jgi:predicted ATPase/class 3 adenylate cyclase